MLCKFRAPVTIRRKPVPVSVKHNWCRLPAICCTKRSAIVPKFALQANRRRVRKRYTQKLCLYPLPVPLLRDLRLRAVGSIPADAPEWGYCAIVMRQHETAVLIHSCFCLRRPRPNMRGRRVWSSRGAQKLPNNTAMAIESR